MKKTQFLLFFLLFWGITCSVPRHALAIPEPLEPVSFSHDVKLQYGSSLSQQTATAIAEAFALHGAFNRAARWLTHRRELLVVNHTKPSLGTKNEFLIANHLYRFYRSTIATSETIDGSFITVEVTIKPIPKFKKQLLAVIEPSSSTRIFEAVFDAERGLLEDFSSTMFNDKQQTYLLNRNRETKRYYDRIASQLRALKAYRKLVPQFEKGLWDNPKKMLAKVNALLKKAPEEAVLLHAKGSALFQLKDNIGAISYYNEALERSPNLVVALHDRGTAYLRTNLPHMALVDYDQAIRLSPKNPHLYISHGAADLVQGDFETMCSQYHTACTLGMCDELHWALSRKLCKKLPAQN